MVRDSTLVPSSPLSHSEQDLDSLLGDLRYLKALERREQPPLKLAKHLLLPDQG